MRRMLITGSTGFVGSAFARRVGSRYEITCATRRPSREEDVEWDLEARLPSTLPSADVVVHLAALTAKESSDSTDPDEYRRLNVLGTANLLAALESAPSYFLYVSTADVYGQPGGVISEGTPPSPHTPYAESKLEAEASVSAYCDARGIAWGVARLGLIYGPGESAYRKAIPTFITLALAGEPIPIIGRGVARRHYLYVEDAAEALALMVERSYRGVLNLVGSTVTSIAELAALIIDLTGHEAGVEWVEPDRREFDVLFDPARLTSTGFTETVDLAEGLGREIEWYRAPHAPVS